MLLENHCFFLFHLVANLYFCTYEKTPPIHSVDGLRAAPDKLRRLIV